MCVDTYVRNGPDQEFDRMNIVTAYCMNPDPCKHKTLHVEKRYPKTNHKFQTCEKHGYCALQAVV